MPDSGVQFSQVRLFATPWTVAHQASLSITNSWSLLKLMSIELVMPSNHLILCCPLLLPPSIFSSIRVFSNESVLRIRWPKYWGFSSQVSSPTTQFKASVLQCSALFIIQFSHPYKSTGKTIALIIPTFVSKLIALLFNMLSRFVFQGASIF